jgi:hypothetical protein
VPGISGQTDLDRFNGSLDDLLAYANGGGAGSGGSPMPSPAPAPAPANGCYSNTLGRTMPANACVQSASNSEWYQCDDGAWTDRWTDPTACNGTYPL